MAYTILDNKAGVLNTRGPVSSSLSSADARSYRSGLVSPNGELMIIPTRYRNNDSSLNHGIDVRKSGSNGVWDLISSVPQRTTSGLIDLVWVNNKEFIFTTNDAYEEMGIVTASAGGVDFGLHKVITRNDNSSGATNWKLEISADKDALLAYHEPGSAGDQYVWVFNSGSADDADAGWNWTQTVRVTNQSSKDVYSARWLRTNDEFAVGDSNNNKVWIVQRTGSSLDGWPSYVPSAGAASAYSITGSQASSYFGMTMEWHTASNSLLIFNNAQVEVHASSSQGYSGQNQPAYTLTGSSFDGGSGALTGYSSKHYKGSIFYRMDATYHDTLTIDSVYVLENGSNTGGYPGGWRSEFLTQSGMAEIYNTNPEDRAPGQIFIGGGILSLEPGRNASLNQSATNFHVFTTGLGTEGAVEPTAIDGEVSSSVVAANGGLVQAGNTDTNPSAQANIPAGALSGNTTVTVAILSQSAGKGTATTDISALGTAIIAPRASSDIIRFVPHGTSFSSPAILSWNITGSTSAIRIFRRSNASSAWAELATSKYSFDSGQVHVTASSFSDYIAVGGASMAVTKIGTKLIKDGVVTTVKLGSSTVQRDDIGSGSVQVVHLDTSAQARNDHVDFVNGDYFYCGDASDNETKAFSFTQLKTALSLSNAARGNEGAIQYNDGSGFDGIAKITTDGVHLTASNAGKVVFAYTGVSGSTGEIYSSAKTTLTVNAKTTLKLNINGTDELDLTATTLQPSTDGGLNLGAAGNKYGTTYLSVLTASSTAESTLHKGDVDALTVGKLNLDSGASVISGSGTASIHQINVDEGTFGGVKFSTARASAAYMITGSGTAQIHKLDSDEGDFRKVIATVVTGSGTSTFHKTDVDEGTFNKATANVVTSSGTSVIHKIDGDEGDFRKVVATNITSSGTSNLHVVTGNDISGSSGKFYKIVVDDLSARKITSGVTTSEHFEVPQKQYIAYASGSTGVAAEGAGLQIGGTAGTGSAGVASIVMGDAGSGAGLDLLLKIGSTQGASLSGSVSDGGQRFGVTGSISGSVGIFHTVTINTAIGNQDSIMSGSTFNAQTVTGALAQIFEIDSNQANIGDLDGTSATFTTVSGTTVQAHTLDTDKLTGNDVDGVSMTITSTVSGSTVDGHLLDVDKIEVRTLTATSTISGSGTATIHKITSDILSGSKTTPHTLTVDKLQLNDIVTNDVIKKAHLNCDIVKSATNSHGGLVFNNGQLSVGWHRRIFSRSSKKIVNRSQPTQGSGSLYTTCSLPPSGSYISMVSGSEMVYFNGLLLVKSNGVAGNPRDGDYRIDYNGGEVFLHETLTMDADDVVVVQYLSGSQTL